LVQSGDVKEKAVEEKVKTEGGIDPGVGKGVKPRVWCFTTYFTEGLPYSIVRMMSMVFFTDIGMKERYIGYLNFLGIPWNMKFLWAPLVDIFGKKRTWMILIQVLITLFTAAIAGICFYADHLSGTGFSTSLLVFIFIALAFFSATNDIVIDGYYMEGLPDPKEQAAFTGYRVFAYRMSMIAIKFGVIYTVGVVTKTITGGNAWHAWGYGFGAAAIVMGIFSIFHLLALPDFEGVKKAAPSVKKVFSDFITSFSTYLEISNKRTVVALTSGFVAAISLFAVLLFVKFEMIQALAYAIILLLAVLVAQARPVIALSLIFIIFYKIGDEIIFSMGTPFLKRFLLVSNVQLAWMTGLVGLVGSIAGTTVGGLWIKKNGLKKSIWPLTILMNVNILAYVWLAWQKPLATTSSGILIIGAVYCYEQFAAGLGNASLIVYILQTCKKEFKAGHYAIGSAFMSIFSSVFGGFGGVIVEKMGYTNLFLIGFAATIPAMLFMFWVPIKEQK
jgi:MFS transporter, PAT family, beta-lactamase induction signal transducer AmpG